MGNRWCCEEEHSDFTVEMEPSQTQSQPSIVKVQRMSAGGGRMSFFSNFFVADMPEAQMKAAFAKVDVGNTGFLDKSRIREAMKDLGKQDDEIALLLSQIPSDFLDFEAFKDLIRLAARTTNIMKPVEVAAQFASLFQADTDDALRAAFDDVDKDGNGLLDRREIADALRGAGKVEKEVQGFLDSMWQEELDFEGFRELVLPKWRVVNALSALVDSDGVSSNDDQLKKMFDRIDEDGSGSLDHDEIRRALIRMGRPSADVEKTIADLKMSEYSFEAFKEMVRSMPKASSQAPPARRRIDHALAQRKKVHDSGKLICFSGGGIPSPFEVHLYAAERDMRIVGDESVKFLLFQKDGKGGENGTWRLQSIVEEGTAAKYRFNLPRPWRGLKGNALSEATGIEGCIRVSLNGIVADHMTEEGAIAMFDKALSMQA